MSQPIPEDEVPEEKVTLAASLILESLPQDATAVLERYASAPAGKGKYVCDAFGISCQHTASALADLSNYSVQSHWKYSYTCPESCASERRSKVLNSRQIPSQDAAITA
jgi:hypothetical protein